MAGSSAKEVPTQDWPVFTVRLHPVLVAFLEARGRNTGLAVESEITHIVGAAMEAAALPPPPSDTTFQCSEELMAQKAQCKDCGELIRHNAKLWAERHVQLTGHRVEVSLYYDLRDEDWLDKLSSERRAELDEVRDGDTARALAQSLLAGLKH